MTRMLSDRPDPGDLPRMADKVWVDDHIGALLDCFLLVPLEFCLRKLVFSECSYQASELCLARLPALSAEQPARIRTD